MLALKPVGITLHKCIMGIGWHGLALNLPHFYPIDFLATILRYDSPLPAIWANS